MEIHKLSLAEGEERMTRMGFAPHSLHNLVALATGGGVAELRVLTLVARATSFGSRFRVIATDEGPHVPEQRRYACFEVRTGAECLCSSQREGLCDACWETRNRAARRPPLQ